jgi:hypothetical protein
MLVLVAPVDHHFHNWSGAILGFSLFFVLFSLVAGVAWSFDYATY